MPKRDEAYMRGQRDLIARAALEVLLDKGLHEASLREICTQAGVSIGAFYNHFSTKTDAIVAARALDLAQGPELRAATRWSDYLELMSEIYCSRDQQRLRRRRLSLQLAAELMQLDENPEGLSEIYQLQRQQVRNSLRAIRGAGEITLPLGLDRTVEMHAMLGLGASYRLSNDLDLSVEEALEILEEGLKITAGKI